MMFCKPLCTCYGIFSGSSLQLRGSFTCPKNHKKHTSASKHIFYYEKTALFLTKRSVNKQININILRDVELCPKYILAQNNFI